ncbi:hypothetical protein JL09_g6781, partial [Pichia kudriavzevii]
TQSLNDSDSATDSSVSAKHGVASTEESTNTGEHTSTESSYTESKNDSVSRQETTLNIEQVDEPETFELYENEQPSADSTVHEITDFLSIVEE